MMKQSYAEPVALKKVKVKDDFWGKYIKLVREEVIPYQWEVLNDRVPGVEPSHAIENFRIAAGLSQGEFYGYVFQDSDVAKWLEAVAYSLTNHADEKLEALADEVIELIGKAQQPDGYLNTYFTIKAPEKRWTNERDMHELYCAGHMMEAAVAYYEATGKRRLLEIMCAFADHIDTVFGTEEGKKRGYSGHQEVEMALVKLYKATGNEKYLKLSKYFLDERGQQPFYFDIEAKARGEEGKKGHFGDYSDEYRQSHLPVREQTAAVGHAVRAVYMYAAMADVAVEAEDPSLADACRTLWENVTRRQMYVTGGIGSQGYGEDFTFDYDLPNDTCYNETCASVGLIFWAHRMLKLEMDGDYADVMERALYNGAIVGMSLDGKKYFYVNPLEVWPALCEKRHDHECATTRQGWFGCACCPPNLARLLSSLGEYIYSVDGDTVFTHLYIGNQSEIQIGGQTVEISQETNYPWQGNVKIRVNPQQEAEFTVAVRIPGWCRNASVRVNGEKVDISGINHKGYVRLTRVWGKESRIELDLDMEIQRIQANPRLREDAGKVAIQRGPLVYCLEEIDNSPNLQNIILDENPGFTSEHMDGLLGGVTVIRGKALRNDESQWNGQLYRELHFEKVSGNITAVPYYAWNNRDEGEMTVWIRQLKA